MLNILKKYKQLILGILIGVLFTAIPVSAAVKEYNLKLSDCKIMVDGVEYKDKNLPILVMDPGYNYLPAAVFRNICNTIGIGFEFDNTTKQIQIDTKKLKNIPEIEVIKEVNVVEEVPLNKYGLPDFSNYKGKIPELQSNGEYRYFYYDGIKYIVLPGRPDLAFKLPKPYRFECPTIDGKVSFIVQLVKLGEGKREVIIDEVPCARYRSSREFCIQYDYYVNSILPLIEGAE